MSEVLKFLLFLLAVAILLWLAAPWLERRLVFHPTRTWDLDPALAQPAEPVTFRSSDGVSLSGLWMPATAPLGVLLYAHGNAGNLSHRIPTAHVWRDRLRLSILLFDYRGYGRSEGSPSEEGIFLDTVAAFEEAKRLGGDNPILLGRSLGTVPVTRLAAREEVRGLILDSPMTNARDMARHVLPLPGIGYLASFRLDNLEEIAAVRCPLLILHGEYDRVVPLQQGRRVFEAAATPKRFLLLEGDGHNDDRTRAGVIEVFAEFVSKLNNDSAVTEPRE